MSLTSNCVQVIGIDILSGCKGEFCVVNDNLVVAMSLSTIEYNTYFLCCFLYCYDSYETMQTQRNNF